MTDATFDLGCGAGRFLDLLTSRYSELLGVGASPRMIDLARPRHPSARLEIADLWDVTPDRFGTFDLVLSVNTLHHLGPDPARYLSHVRRLVRPGGHVVIIDVVRHAPAWASNVVMYRAYRMSRTFAGAVKAGAARRSVDAALAVYRLRRHQQWKSLAADAYTLGRSDFHWHCAAAFPGAVLHRRAGGEHLRRHVPAVGAAAADQLGIHPAHHPFAYLLMRLDTARLPDGS